MILDAAAHEGHRASGRCRTPPSWARRCRPSPPRSRRACSRRTAPARLRARPSCCAAPRPIALRRPTKAARRRRARRALRGEGLLLRAGHEPAARGLARAQLGPRPRRARAHLEGRLHHPRAVPRAASRRPTTATPACRTCCSTPTSPTSWASARRAGGASSARAVGAAASPLPAMTAALAYYDTYRRARLPAQPHPGAARLLRRAHLRAHRPPGQFHTDWHKVGTT